MVPTCYPTTVAMLRGPVRRAVLFLVTFASSCGAPRSDDEQPSPGIVAELHLHQWDEASHYTATFVRKGVAFEPTQREQLVNFEPQPVMRVGECARYEIATCQPTCDGAREYCALGGRCTAYEPLRPLDGGVVTIRGGKIVPTVKLVFDARAMTYRSDLPFSARAFAGGEALEVEVGGQVVVVPAPRAIVFADAPLLDSRFREITWAADGELARFELTVTGAQGESISIVCLGGDRGSLRIPDALFVRLPGPPRLFRLDYERLARRRVELTPGRFAVVNVASARFVEGRD